MSRPICIYHSPCADGFGAAWAVWKRFGDTLDYHAGVYGEPPPDVAGRDVIMVDFSYKRPVLDAMAEVARTILILDHHKTAAEDLAGFEEPDPAYYPEFWHGLRELWNQRPVRAVFDMERSGAGLAWDFFHPGKPRPKLIDHIEDRDLWRFAIPGTREVQSTVFSYGYDFATYDKMAAEIEADPKRFIAEGSAIERKLQKDIAELLGITTRRMLIGGHDVPVANLPYTMASEAAGKLAQDAPFGACYFDRADARVFSLRSRGDFDVSAIAKLYGGGGHKNAAGFQRPIGWEGEDRMTAAPPALAPCPFCGGTFFQSEGDGGPYWVFCHTCQAEGPAAKTVAEAIAAWNRRAPPAIPPAEQAPRPVAEMLAELERLRGEATPGPWRWQGEDYRGGWGWQLLVGSEGQGVICGEGHDGGPYKELRAYMPIDPKFCKTGMMADESSAPCVHVREPDAAYIAACVNAHPALAAEIGRLSAEVARCHARLEIDHVFVSTGDGPMERREIPMAERGDMPDGIECRNETIKQQEQNCETLRAVRKDNEAAIERLTSENERLTRQLATHRPIVGNRGYNPNTGPMGDDRD